MNRHAVRATVASAALNLAVLSPSVWTQSEPSAVRELDELRARAGAGQTDAFGRLTVANGSDE